MFITTMSQYRDSMKWKLIFDNFPGILLNISVEVMVTLHGESTSHLVLFRLRSLLGYFLCANLLQIHEIGQCCRGESGAHSCLPFTGNH